MKSIPSVEINLFGRSKLLTNERTGAVTTKLTGPKHSLEKYDNFSRKMGTKNMSISKLDFRIKNKAA